MTFVQKCFGGFVRRCTQQGRTHWPRTFAQARESWRCEVHPARGAPHHIDGKRHVGRDWKCTCNRWLVAREKKSTCNERTADESSAPAGGKQEGVGFWQPFKLQLVCRSTLPPLAGNIV